MQKQSQAPTTLRVRKVITSDTLARLVADYESKHLLNPLKKSRTKEIVIARHSLSFILMNRFGLGPSEVGKLLEKNHATAINSKKIVTNMLLTKNLDYVDEIVKWAEVFDTVLPNDNLSNIIIQQRVEDLLYSLTSDIECMVKVLDQLKEKILTETTHLEVSGVI